MQTQYDKKPRSTIARATVKMLAPDGIVDIRTRLQRYIAVPRDRTIVLSEADALVLLDAGGHIFREEQLPWLNLTES